MYRRTTYLLTALCLMGATALPLSAAEQNPGLETQALGLLKKYCYKCHGQNFSVPGLNVLDRAALVARRAGETPFVVPGKPEASLIFQKIKEQEMPPTPQKPSAAEQDVVRRWIAAGALFAPAPVITGKTFVGDADVLNAIADHLRPLSPNQRRLQRYFTFANLANDPQRTEEQMRVYRAALSKTINSLSWESGIVVPQAIDRQQMVFAIDLGRLGWDRRNLWEEVLKEYPYGLTHKFESDRKVVSLTKAVAQVTGTEVPCIRADWFIASATRPPLYHTMLDLPTNARQLEKNLNVDVTDNFLNDRLIRAGFVTSGVSKQNRVIERHVTRYGAYWKSYDFKLNTGEADVLRFPLGPVFKDNPFANVAFKHNGGEIIFNLPNGMQGYLLVDNNDKRLDTAPAEIVEDSLRTANSSIVVNGLSCIACHKNGMQRGEDILRTRSAVNGRALEKVRRLHPEQKVLNQFFRKDEDRFQVAAEKAMAPFLRVGADRKKTFQDFPEPVKEVTELYFQDLTVAQAARELGIDDPRKLQRAIVSSRTLQRLGLSPLVGGRIKRAAWEEPRPVQSLYQETARELGQGTPVVSN